MKNPYQTLGLLIPLTLALFTACSSAESSFEDAKAQNGVDLDSVVQLPDAPRNYCVTLASLDVSGDFDTDPFTDANPDLYGAVCAISSEDPFIVVDTARLDTRLQNCKYVYLQKDDNVFASSLVLSSASTVSDFFDSDDMQDLALLLEDSGAAPAGIAQGNTVIATNNKATIKIKDFKNRPLILATIFMGDDDTVADDSFYNPANIDTDFTNDYPIVTTIYDSQIPTGGQYLHSQVLRHGSLTGNDDGILTMNYTIERGACP